MKILLLILHVLLFFGSMSSSLAQDQWIGAMPVYYNPSFAGSAGGVRLASYTHYSNTLVGNSRTENSLGRGFCRSFYLKNKFRCWI